MSAPTAAPPRGRGAAVAPEPPGPGRAATGWLTLRRFVLRRDPVRLPGWTASVARLLGYAP
ncbi:hypothetical protein, partial [Cellulosimicrobium funkei]